MKPFQSDAAKGLSPEQLERLRAEARSPYKSIRRFFYIAFGLSGALGAYIFLMKILAGNTAPHNTMNLLLQIGLTVAMVYLFWVERDQKGQ